MLRHFCLVAFILVGATTALGQQNTTVQLPQFGVAVNADGVLELKTVFDRGGRMRMLRIGEAKARTAPDLMASSELRKVSLVRLEKAIRAEVAAGRDPDEAMKHLAGLQRVQYVFFYPEENDIVIAGPAEGWVDDGLGRSVGVTSGRPVVLLEDLIVALRAHAPTTPIGAHIGCSIDPAPENLEKLAAFQRTVPKVISQRDRAAVAGKVAQGSKHALGMAGIRVFGVSPNTHFGRVLIEADYRMKLIAIDLEPKPVRMATFLSSLSGATHSTLQRWWFTPDYDCVRVTDDGLSMELVGQGVQLLGETDLIGADGALAPRGGRPDKASQLFTLAFTRKYPEIAAVRPVYAQMRNLIDLSVAAAYMRRHDLYARAEWELGVFADEDRLPVETYDTPKQVECVVNALWKRSRLFVAASGGVSIRPDQALDRDRLQKDDRGLLGRQRSEIDLTASERWWWD